MITVEQKSELLILRKEIEKLIHNEPTSTLEMCLKYRQLSILYNSEEDLAESFYWIGVGYNGLGDNHKAISYYNLANEKNKDNKYLELLHRTQISIGVSYRQIGEYTKAIQSYTSALESNIDLFLDIIYNNMAVIYYNLNELNKSIEFFEKAYECYSKKGEVVASVGILNNIGRIYTIQKKYRNAEVFLLKTIEISETNNLYIEFINAKFNYATFKNEIGKVDEAYQILNETYLLFDKHYNLNLKYSTLFLLAEICTKLKKYDQAGVCFKEALILSQEISPQELTKSLEKYYSFLEQQQDYERAFHYLKQLYTISNDLSREEKTKELNKARLEFENKEQELKLEKLNAVKVLYDQLAEQSLELDKKNRKLENINNDLMHFSYALSHDLREPARLVKSYSDVLTFMLKSKLNEKETEMFAHLKNGAEKMEILIEDLHRYAVLGVNENMKKEVDLNKIIEGVLMILQLPIQESNATIEFDQLPTINTYPTLISQLFQNLISNALKYRKKDNIPMIKIKYAKIDNNHEIRIIDNGIGIPISEQPRIFRLFKRATNHKYEGTGVGLAFCQKIMDKINGNIQVYSRGENLGSEFIIKFVT